MALVLYKCDVCKRDITFPRNPKGLETIGRCTVTLGCRGKLYQEDLLEDFVRGTLPADVVGLDNWQQRRVVYDHTQQQTQVTWIINHGLGTFPVVSTFVEIPTPEDPTRLVEVTPIDIIAIDDDTIKVTFPVAYSGVAQLVARSSDSQLFTPTVNVTVDDSFTQVTASSTMTIATVATETNIRVFFNYITPVGGTVPVSLIVDDVPGALSPWVSSDRVLIQGRIFTVRSFDSNSLAVASGLVPDGSRIVFNGIQTDINIPIPIVPSTKQVYMLLADAPYGDPDRRFDSVVDMFDVSKQASVNSMVLSSLDTVITPSTLTSVHPLIRSL
jgi:hypothetical protein